MQSEEWGVPKARLWTDDRGRLNVVGQGVLMRAGTRVRRKRRMIVPKGDPELGAEIVRQLNVQFAMGDASWLEGQTDPEPKPVRPSTLSEWAPLWLQSCAPPVIGQRTWYNYSIHVRDLVERLGQRSLGSIDTAEVLHLRSALESSRGKRGAPLSRTTVKDRLGVLAMMLRDARIEGLIATNPLADPLPRRRTKRGTGTQRVRRVQFLPFEASELAALLRVLGAPAAPVQKVYYPPTEMLLLTGLRWGEVAGVLWDDISWKGRRVNIRRAVVRGQDDPTEPTKTGAQWEIELRAPLEHLLQTQRTRSYLGRVDGRVFPGRRGSVMSYHEWRKRGWIPALRAAKVSPREGDAQKALRKSYVTAALICGENAKRISETLGHANPRMILEKYDAFLGPESWPEADEVAMLRQIYGWGNVRPEGSHVAPRGSHRRS